MHTGGFSFSNVAMDSLVFASGKPSEPKWLTSPNLLPMRSRVTLQMASRAQKIEHDIGMTPTLAASCPVPTERSISEPQTTRTARLTEEHRADDEDAS